MCARKLANVLVSYCDSVSFFVKKGVGLDLIFKVTLGIVRLIALHARDETLRDIYTKFSLRIINCRMLANHFRYLISFDSAVKAFTTEGAPTFHRVLLGMCSLLRSFEQICGDFNYYQMTFMRHWSRKRLSFCYWFFKSLSLTCGLLDELLLLRMEVASREWRSKTPEERTTYLKTSAISITRYLLDMLVYYQWVPCYNPYKTLQYLSAITSGSLAIYVASKEIQASRASASEGSLRLGSGRGAGALAPSTQVVALNGSTRQDSVSVQSSSFTLLPAKMCEARRGAGSDVHDVDSGGLAVK
ncbi:hypothetical protein TRVL_02253 [Trypanosoma vivax]|nr:hypothetical protein TRVL_02253 [Trypanosoma vivax]